MWRTPSPYVAFPYTSHLTGLSSYCTLLHICHQTALNTVLQYGLHGRCPGPAIYSNGLHTHSIQRLHSPSQATAVLICTVHATTQVVTSLLSIHCTLPPPVKQTLDIQRTPSLTPSDRPFPYTELHRALGWHRYTACRWTQQLGLEWCVSHPTGYFCTVPNFCW